MPSVKKASTLYGYTLNVSIYIYIKVLSYGPKNASRGD